MMTDPEIYSILAELFDDVLGADDVKLTAETTADDVDGWDSLNHIRLMIAVQKRFGISMSGGEIGRLKNVGELVHMIGSKTGK